MFCTYCGSAVTADQSLCPNCGRSTTGAHVDSAARTRVEAHIHLLAILYFVLGAFWLVPAVIFGALAAFITAPLVTEHADRIALVLAPGVLLVFCVLFLASAVVRFAVGWGLMKMRPWARTLALVVAFFSLIQPPFDTALGIYTLFVLLPDAAGDEYRRMCQTSIPGPIGAAEKVPG